MKFGGPAHILNTGPNALSKENYFKECKVIFFQNFKNIADQIVNTVIVVIAHTGVSGASGHPGRYLTYHYVRL